MPDRFMQSDPTPSGGTPSLPEVHIDLSGIGNALVQAIKDHANELGASMWASFSNWLYLSMRAMFLAMWHATLLPMPHELTDRFGPVMAMMPNTLAIAAAGIGLAMALLGLKVILQRVPAQTAVVEEVIGRIVLYAAVLGALPWIVSHAIDLEQNVAQSISVRTVESVAVVPTGAMDPLGFSEVIALAIMLILGVRLWFKLASNVVHVAAAVAWSPVAMVCGLFPQTSWVPSLWWREFFGRLAGAILATVAVGLGLALALGYPGLLSIAGGGGAFLAAADMVDWLARSPGDRMGGVLGVAASGVRTGLAVASGGGGGPAARAAIPANELSTRADMFGFD